MMLFVIMWLTAGYVTLLIDDFWQFLNYWGEGAPIIYFAVAFGVAMHRVVNRSKDDYYTG